MHDELEHDGPGAVPVLLAVGAVAVAALLALFWLFNTPPALPVKNSIAAPPLRTTTTAPALTIAPSTTSSVVPPTPGWVPPDGIPSLPPPELPTMTAPVPSPIAAAPAASVPQPAPSPSPPSLPPQRPVPAISNVSLSCQLSGKKVTAQLSFSTTTAVGVTLSAGNNALQREVGPGNVSLSNTGRSGRVCSAVIAGQRVGPIPAT